MNQVDVTIIGAGISGLSSAYWLQQMRPDLKVVILERDLRPGGRIRTNQVGPYLVEAGPDSFVTQRPGMLEFVRELGLESRLSASQAHLASTYLLNDSQLEKLPAGLHMGIPSRPWTVALSPILSMWGKLRLALEPFIARRVENGDESLGSFVRRRLGQEPLEKLIGPLSAGIFGTDPEQLSLGATFAHLAQYEQKFGSLTRAMWSNPVPKGGANFQTFVNGMQELVDRLATVVRAPILTGVTVTSIGTTEGDWLIQDDRGQIYRSGHVVLAIPSDQAAPLLADCAPRLSRSLQGFTHSTGAAVHMGWERRYVGHSLQGYGFVTRYPAPGPLVACTWSSQKFAGRAPESDTLLRAFLRDSGAFRVEECSDDQLVDHALESLRWPLDLRGRPQMVRVERYIRAFPHYHPGHLGRVAELEKERANFPGLHWLGALFGAGGIPACVSQARTVAHAVTLN